MLFCASIFLALRAVIHVSPSNLHSVVPESDITQSLSLRAELEHVGKRNETTAAATKNVGKI